MNQAFFRLDPAPPQTGVEGAGRLQMKPLSQGPGFREVRQEGPIS